MIELMALLGPLAGFLENAKKYAAHVAGPNGSVDPDAVTVFVGNLARDWHPVVQGKRPLDDPETRRCGIRFLVGIAIPLAGLHIRPNPVKV